MQIDFATKQDLQELERKILAALGPRVPSDTEDQWLRTAETRKFLQCSYGTLQSLRIKGVIPYTKVGGIYLYNRKGILKVLNENQKNNG